MHMHMVEVVVGLVCAGHSNFCLGCTIGLAKLRKCYSHLIGASFLAVKAIWGGGCLLAKNAD